MREFWRRERPDGTFGRIWWTNLFGRRVSTGCASQRAARIWKAAREREGADPRLAAAQKAVLEDAMRDLYDELRRRARKPATQARAKQKLGHFPRLWGAQCKMAAIDAKKIGAYIDARLADSYEGTGFKTPARITIRDELAFLRQMLKLARRHGTYPYPVEDVLPLSFDIGHKPRKDWVTEEDLPKLLARLEPRHQAHVLFFVVTAGRLADSCRARPEDFDLSKWRSLVRGSKTDGSFRTIPISKFLQMWVLWMLVLAEVEPDGRLFRDWPNLHRDLAAACTRAGVPVVTTNGLRRTFGKWHRLRGFDLDTISKFFGHTTPKLVRDVYADIEGDELAALAARYETSTDTHTRPSDKPVPTRNQ